ncbi:DUF1289 domain-containing protein [Phenylobacterium sp.]|uniref:DUF1289 domain-containing protein n=1 Tax=Phenylobacterium sp. TaxID=1871053 RepID=UPI000BC5E34F|nr:MAG: DUF1289 domain-containing protein [Burkholderiales bacterium 12-64-5]OYX29371.1 MAG: DUF1289 domain-containing protein [Caulobacterales bacterium 32-69-10]
MKSGDPCISVCSFDGRSGWCIGCGRTVPEIRAWRKMQPRARQMMSKDLKRRVDRLSEQGKGHTLSDSASPPRGSLS